MSDLSIPPLKRCTKCGEEKPATSEYFHRNKSAHDGLVCRCKECANKHANDWYQANREKAIERITAHDRAHPEDVNRRARERYKRDPDKVQQKNQKWVANNPEKIRERVRRRRARRVNSLHTFTVADECFAIEFFNGCCAVCGRQLKDLFGSHSMSIDHWIPLSKGGSGTPDNMIPLCFGVNGCNNRKNDKMPSQWLVETFGVKKGREIAKRVNEYFQVIRARGLA